MALRSGSYTSHLAPVEAICEIWVTQVGLLGYDGVKAGLDSHHE